MWDFCPHIQMIFRVLEKSWIFINKRTPTLGLGIDLAAAGQTGHISEGRIGLYWRARLGYTGGPDIARRP